VSAVAAKADRLNELLSILGQEAQKLVVIAAEVSGSSFPSSDFKEAQRMLYEIAEQIGGQEVIWKNFVDTDIDADQLISLYDESCHIANALNKIKTLISQRFSEGQTLVCAENMDEKKLNRLEQMIVELKGKRQPVVGYLLRGKKLIEFDDEFKNSFPFLLCRVQANI
jgi:hypothetical protein